MKKENSFSAKNIALVVFGTLILAFGTSVFIIPSELVAGGVSGYAIIINKILGATLSVDFLITVLVWGLFLLGAVALGKGFALKTLLSSLVYPVGIAVFSRLREVSGRFFDFSYSAYPQLAVLLSAIFGGILVGTGCALTFLGGGSSGGIDVLAFTLCKVFKRLKSSTAIFLIDSVAVILGVFVIGDIVISMLGLVCAFVSAVTVDKLFIGGSRAFVAQIITDRYVEINRAVIERLERTATIIDVVGGFSGKPKKMLSVIFSYAQYAELMNIVSTIDSTAFITVHQAHEIGGEGWSYGK